MNHTHLRQCECGRMKYVGQEQRGEIWRYCRVCDDVTSWDKQQTTTDTTPIQRHQLRLHNTNVRVSTGKARRKALHICADGETACRVSCETTMKDLAVFPVGYRDWCGDCLQPAQQPDAKAVKETLKHALQEAERLESVSEVRDYYKRQSYSPTVYKIRDWYGSWSDALIELGVREHHPDPSKIRP